MQQRPDELREFLDLVKSENVHSYLEVGVRHGLLMYAVGSTMVAGSVLVGVERDKGGSNIIRRVKLSLIGCNIRMVWGDSHLPSTVAEALALGPYDLAFVDGNHSLAGVSADWEAYGPMTRIVAFHDISSRGLHGYGVAELWDTLKPRYHHREILGEVGGMGIGILWREEPAPNET